MPQISPSNDPYLLGKDPRIPPSNMLPPVVEQPSRSNMFADLLAQISAASPNWAYDDAQVSQLDDAFKRQFAEQQQQQRSPYALPPPSPVPQMPTPGIPTATGGLDPARLGEIADARRLQAEQAQGIPRIPTATPGMNRPAFDVPVHQMPRSQRMGKPMSPMFEGPQRQPGMMRPRPGNPVAQRRQSGMSQPLQPLRQQQQQAPQSQFAGYSSGNRNIGSSRMPNTGQMTSSYGGQQRLPTAMTPMQGQSSPRQPSQISNRRPALDQYGGYGP